MMSKSKELHVLKLEPQNSIWTNVTDKKREKLKGEVNRPFMSKLNNLISVTTTVDLYFYLFEDEVLEKKYTEILLPMINMNEVFKKSTYKRYKNATRTDLKQHYDWNKCTNIKGTAITYKDNAQEWYAYENYWISETYAREIIKKFNKMMGE